jgi:excisionase family DNA binding protein
MVKDSATIRSMSRTIGTRIAAGILGVSPTRVWQLIVEGELPSQKVGRDHLLRRRDVEALAASRAVRARGDRRLAHPPEAPKWPAVKT